MATKLIRVDTSLIDLFGNIGKEYAEDVKKKYNLTHLFVPDTLASQILAGRYKGKKCFEFKIEKTGINRGRLILVK